MKIDPDIRMRDAIDVVKSLPSGNVQRYLAVSTTDQPFIIWIAGCRSMSLRKCMGGRTRPFLAVGSGKGRGGSSSVWEEAVKGAGPQKERDGGGYFPATADSIKQQYRTAFCALKQTRSSYKPAIYVDSGLSFDASSGVYGGEDLALAVGSGKVRGGSSSVLGEGMKRAGPQRERDGADSFLATADSIRQQHRTAFCALKHMRSSYKAAIYYVDSGLSFDAPSEVYGREDLALAAGGGRARRTGRYI